MIFKPVIYISATKTFTMARPPRPRVVWKFLLLLRLSIYVVTHHIYPRASPPLYCTLLPQSSPVLPPGDLSFNSSTTHFLSLPSLLRPRRQKFKPPPLSLYSGHPPGGWLIALLLLSGDIESNPGPPTIKDPCGICSKSCKNHAIQCDFCNSWIHKKCSHINPSIWPILSNTSLTWECFNCGIPNFSNSFFDDLVTQPFTSNRFSPLSDLKPDSGPHFPPLPSFKPIKTSSPKKDSPQKKPSSLSSSPNSISSSPNAPPDPSNLSCNYTTKPTSTSTEPPLSQDRNSSSVTTTLIVNFQSLRNKIPIFNAYLSVAPADIILGTETWLHKHVSDAELMLDDYDLYRKERPGNSNSTCVEIETLTEDERRRKKVGGGVILAVKKSLASKPLNVSIRSESAYCQIPQAGKPPTIIGCVYRPLKTI